MNAQPDGLGKSLFGGKARGQVTQAADRHPGLALSINQQLLRAQHLLGKALAAPLQGLLDATDVAQVGTDTHNHADPARRARTISALKSAMACFSPTKTAWPINAWPM